ncbi:MAG: dipeptidase [Planctomycetota bacterium]|jgi:membrane dipeptidase
MTASQLRRRARAIHRRCVLVDGHNDHFIMKLGRGDPLAFTRVARRYHSDAPRLLRGGMTASFFMVGGGQLERSMVLIQQAREEVAAHPEKLLLCTRPADIRKAKRTGRLGVMLSWESCAALGNNVEILRLAYDLGVRVSTLTHGEGGRPEHLQGTRSPFRYASPGQRSRLRRRSRGLTRFGKAVVKEMNRLGILIDLAHANDRAVEDVLKLTTKPVVSTHGGAYGVCPHTRCSTDSQIRAIAATGGLVSIAFFDGFIARPPKRATVEGIVDQIAYVADLVGVEGVGIGTDFDGLGEEWPIVRTADRLPVLTEAMVRRGFSEAEIGKIWGGNYMRVLKATL